MSEVVGEGRFACPVCGKSSRLFARCPNADILRCDVCEHAFTDLSTIKENEIYNSAYYHVTHKNWFLYPNFKLFRKICHEISKNNVTSVLDIGCGNGEFLRFLKVENPELDLTGIDLSSEAVPDDKIKFIEGDFQKYGFDERFDAFITLAVIEHVYDVKSFMRRIHQLLNDKGIACIMTVNEKGLIYNLAKFLNYFGISMAFNRLYEPHHLNHFSKSSLSLLITNDDYFEVLSIIDHNTPVESVDFPNSNFLGQFFYREIIKLLFFMGDILGANLLQTIIVKKNKSLAKIVEKHKINQMVERRRKSRPPERVQKDRIRQFLAGATARIAADLVGVNRHTVTLYFNKLRELIVSNLAENEPWLSGEVEVDESYFGGSRKGKR